MPKNSILTILCALLCCGTAQGQDRIRYNHPGLTVDLGVGLWAWPLPMDYDGDGDYDLVVTCPDKPYNGTYFFENPGGDKKMPVFKPGKRISHGPKNAQVSQVNGKSIVTTPSRLHEKFINTEFKTSRTVPVAAKFHRGRIRANQWKLADHDGDGLTDIIVGIGDWVDYGWDNAFDKEGNWTNGPLHGYVFLIRNIGTEKNSKYANPEKIEAGGQPIDVYGMPSPSLADFDGDGDLDLICGEFLDGFTWFENTGTRKAPVYAKGRRLPIRMDLQMITPTAIDWDRDGDPDLICGDEDGRVAFIENTGKPGALGLPGFLEPRYFRQEAADVKFGALVTPVGFDWDGDGDEDLVCGNTAGYIGFIENLSGPKVEFPKWAEPKYLKAGPETLRLQAGPKGSIQGPCEAKWGYSTLSIADWDHDGLPDIIANGIWGRVTWFRNIGRRTEPQLAKGQPVRVNWKEEPMKPTWNWWKPEAGTLATQWRTTPFAHDWNRDGLTDLVMLDHEGYLSFMRGTRENRGNTLHPPERIFWGAGAYDSGHRTKSREPGGDFLRLNMDAGGKSGRRKLCLADWDGDGRTDLLVNSLNVNFMRNMGSKDGKTTFRDVGTLSNLALAGHTTSPTTVDWNGDGIRDLLIGAEDGFLYYHRNPRSK